MKEKDKIDVKSHDQNSIEFLQKKIDKRMKG